MRAGAWARAAGRGGSPPELPSELERPFPGGKGERREFGLAAPILLFLSSRLERGPYTSSSFVNFFKASLPNKARSTALIHVEKKNPGGRDTPTFVGIAVGCVYRG